MPTRLGRIASRRRTRFNPTMRILLAPDKFKGTFSSRQVCDNLGRALAEFHPLVQWVACPLADGGEGTLDAFQSAGMVFETLGTQDALGRPRSARLGRLNVGGNRLRLVESAECLGLSQIRPSERAPLHSSSFGLGRLLRSSGPADRSNWIVGLGGTATMDGGAGFLQALGAQFKTSQGVLGAPASASDLGSIRGADLSQAKRFFAGGSLTAWCDVLSPLLGPTGAVGLYGRQKGLKASESGGLEGALESFLGVLEKASGRPLRDLPGSGAAGGLGMALAALGADLVSGFAGVSEILGLEERIRACEVVLTGEGRLDRSTREGKAPWGVLQMARRLRKPCFILVGSLEGPAPGWDGVLNLQGGAEKPDWESAVRDFIKSVHSLPGRPPE